MQAVVEGGRVGSGLGDDREHLLEFVAEDFGLERTVAGAHPVTVAAQGVDLAVVGDVAVRVGAVPGRKRVGAESAMDDRQRADEILLRQVRVILPHLPGGEHALVDDAVGRQDRDVELLLGFGREFLPELDGVFRTLADEIQAGVELRTLVEILTHADEHLADDRLALFRRRPDGRIVHRHVAPPEHLHAEIDRDLLDRLLALRPPGRILRQEDHPNRILPRLRERDPHFLALADEELVGDLRENARPVAAVRFAPAPAAMLHVFKHLEGVGDDLVGRLAFDMANEPDPAGVMLESRVVQTLRLGKTGNHFCRQTLRVTVHRESKVRRPTNHPGAVAQGRNGPNGRS